MMVDAGCVLVFREGKMISFAKNNKKKAGNFFPAFLFLKFFRILFLLFLFVGFLFRFLFGQHHYVVNVLGHPLFPNIPDALCTGVLPLPFCVHRPFSIRFLYRRRDGFFGHAAQCSLRRWKACGISTASGFPSASSSHWRSLDT